MRRPWALIGLAFVAGCASGPGSTPSVTSALVASATPTVAAAPSGTTLLHDGSLHSGVAYATAGFRQRFTFEVPSATPDRFWFATETTLQHALVIGNPASEGAGASFYLPTGGFDLDGAPAAIPSDFVAWLTTNPHLRVVKRQDLTVGGRSAVALTLSVRVDTLKPSGLCHTATAKCLLIASTAPDAPFRPLVEYPGEEPIVVVVSLPRGQLLIDEDAGVTQASAEALVATLQFVP